MITILSALRSCLLYSWILFTWTSIIVLGSMMMPLSFLRKSAAFSFAWYFTFASFSRNAASFEKSLSFLISSKFVIHLLPIASVIREESPGFASKSHLLWVMPFVLLL